VRTTARWPSDLKKTLRTLPDNAVALLADDDVGKYRVVRVASEGSSLRRTLIATLRSNRASLPGNPSTRRRASRLDDSLLAQGRSNDLQKSLDGLQPVQRRDDPVEVQSHLLVNDHVAETGQTLELPYELVREADIT